MTRYDEYPEHPLYGVPQDVLDAARSVLDGAAEWKDVMQSMVEPLADAVVMRLHEAGFITWPGKGVAHIHDVVRTPGAQEATFAQVAESYEWNERHQFETEPTISKYPLVRWPERAFLGDPGFTKDGGTLDFGVPVVMERGRSYSGDLPGEVEALVGPLDAFWHTCDREDTHRPHKVEDKWCPGVGPLSRNETWAATPAQQERHRGQWTPCDDREPHAPHQMSYDPWRACPGVATDG